MPIRAPELPFIASSAAAYGTTPSEPYLIDIYL